MKKLKIIALSLIIVSWCFSKNIEISGKIIDETSNQKLSNVNIFLNTGEGCSSDLDGNFHFEVNIEKTAILSFSHIGYKMKRIKLSASKSYENLTIYLEPCALSGADVLVTGSRLEKAPMDLTVSARIISHKTVEQEVASNLTDLLHKTPGFRQVWEYHSPLLIRGMSSKHILVMMDGNRRVGTFPGGFMGQNINVYDLKKVEVLRGPASVLYGAGALAGAINLISKDPLDHEKLNIKFSQGYGFNNNENLSLLCVNWGNSRVGVNVSGKLRNTDDYVMGNGETAVNSAVADKDISTRIGVKISEAQQLTLSSKYHDGGPWGKPIGFNNKPWVKVNNEETAFHNSFKYFILGNGIINKIVASGYFDRTQRGYHKRKMSVVTGSVSQHSLVEYDMKYGGGQLYAITKPAESIDLTFGIDGYQSKFYSPEKNWDYTDNTFYRAKGSDGAGTQSLGAHIQSEWQVKPQVLTISAGTRYDVAEVDNGKKTDSKEEKSSSQSSVSGSMGFLYHSTENTRLAFNFGRAFRMPDMNELFNKTVSCVGIKQGNPDLKPEYSWNVDLGFRGKWQKGEVEIATYTNFLEDFINQTQAAAYEDYDLGFENIGKARISGVEISGAYHFFNLLAHNSSLTINSLIEYIYGVDVTGRDSYFGDGEPLHGIPPFRVMLGARFNRRGKIVGQFTNHFVEFSVESVADQNRVPDNVAGPWGAEETEAYTLCELKAGITFPNLPARPGLNLRINNLFDTEYHTLGSYLPAMGRNIKLMAKVEF